MRTPYERLDFSCISWVNKEKPLASSLDIARKPWMDPSETFLLSFFFFCLSLCFLFFLFLPFCFCFFFFFFFFFFSLLFFFFFFRLVRSFRGAELPGQRLLRIRDRPPCQGWD